MFFSSELLDYANVIEIIGTSVNDLQPMYI
jgi:hypothetical protein